MSPANRRGRSLWRLLPVLSLALAIWACGATPLVSHQPPSQLDLSITINGQYTGNTAVVLVDIRISDHANNELVFVPSDAHLTCEGADVKPDYEVFQRNCPRQPTGGAYHFIYTDEHGAATSVVIPIPTGTVALLTPRAGDKVAIPANNTLAIRYTAPTAPPGGSVTMDQVAAICGTNTSPPCGEVSFGQTNITGQVVSGGTGVFQLTGDFSPFQPGEGMVDLAIGVHAPPSQSGFASVNATFADSVAAPITWTR